MKVVRSSFLPFCQFSFDGWIETCWPALLHQIYGRSLCPQFFLVQGPHFIYLRLMFLSCGCCILVAFWNVMRDTLRPYRVLCSIAVKYNSNTCFYVTSIYLLQVLFWFRLMLLLLSLLLLLCWYINQFFVELRYCS